MKNASSTPTRNAFLEKSPLQSRIADDLNAIKKKDRDCFEPTIRGEFADSIDIDEAFKTGRENENRWDYLLGHEPSQQVIAVEPHSAKNDEVKTVIRKRQAAREHLEGHLREDVRISKWLWVASGAVHFANTEKTRILLDQNGIEFVKKVLKKHLPEAKSSVRRTGLGKNRR